MSVIMVHVDAFLCLRRGDQNKRRGRQVEFLDILSSSSISASCRTTTG